MSYSLPAIRARKRGFSARELSNLTLQLLIPSIGRSASLAGETLYFAASDAVTVTSWLLGFQHIRVRARQQAESNGQNTPEEGTQVLTFLIRKEAHVIGN